MVRGVLRERRGDDLDVHHDHNEHIDLNDLYQPIDIQFDQYLNLAIYLDNEYQPFNFSYNLNLDLYQPHNFYEHIDLRFAIYLDNEHVGFDEHNVNLGIYVHQYHDLDQHI